MSFFPIKPPEIIKYKYPDPPSDDDNADDDSDDDNESYTNTTSYIRYKSTSYNGNEEQAIQTTSNSTDNLTNRGNTTSVTININVNINGDVNINGNLEDVQNRTNTNNATDINNDDDGFILTTTTLDDKNVSAADVMLNYGKDCSDRDARFSDKCSFLKPGYATVGGLRRRKQNNSRRHQQRHRPSSHYRTRNLMQERTRAPRDRIIQKPERRVSNDRIFSYSYQPTPAPSPFRPTVVRPDQPSASPTEEMFEYEEHTFAPSEAAFIDFYSHESLPPQGIMFSQHYGNDENIDRDNSDWSITLQEHLDASSSFRRGKSSCNVFFCHASANIMGAQSYIQSCMTHN